MIGRLAGRLAAPADLSTEGGRARDRYRRAGLAALTALGARGIAILASLVSVPLALHHLGPERYGVWTVISGFTLMLAFADMGLGNGVVNGIAAAKGRDDRAAIRALVSSGYAALALVALAVLAIAAVAWPLVPWARVFNVSGALARAEAPIAMAVFLCCFALGVPLALVQKVQAALQEGFYANLWQALASLAALAALVVVVFSGLGLPWLVVALSGAPLAVALANTLWFFARRRDIAPTRAAVSARATREAAALGLRFFVLQAIGSAAYGLDTIIIAQIAGASAVAGYAVPERLFATITLLVGMAMQPLWPAYGEALARGDRAWARRTAYRSLLAAGLLSAVGAGLLFALAPWLIRLWVGPGIAAPLPLLAGLAVWKVIETIGTTAAVFLNGAGRLGFQIVTALVSGAAMVTAKIVLVHAIGPAGIPWGAAVPFFALALLPTLFYIRRVLA